MLFNLKFSQHKVQELHKLIVFFFDQVEKNNPTIFDCTTQFPTWYSSSPVHKMLKVEKLLQEFLKFPQVQQQEIIQKFRESNEIAQLFSNETIPVAVGKDFSKYSWKSKSEGGITKQLSISDFLSELFVSLYKDQLGNKNSSFCKKIGANLSSHYEKFANHNEVEFVRNLVCPCCGLELMRDEENIRNPDHDHLLPKGENLFIFSSVNLKNLFPIGTDCNVLKDTAVLIYSDKNLTNRTLAFYPYDNTAHPYTLFNIYLICDEIPDYNNGYKGLWTVVIEPKDANDAVTGKKIASWDRVFRIKHRLAKSIANKNKSLIDKEFKITRITDGITLKLELQKQLDRNRLEYMFLSTEIELIPKRIFYQWALQNPDFLNSKVIANTIMSTKVDLSF